MLDPPSWCHWLEQASVPTRVRDSVWLFPAIETVHLFGIVALVGSTSILDLRLLGVILKKSSVEALTHRLLLWAWIGFAVQVLTGSFMFASEASTVYINRPFQVKMLMIVLAGINALVFHLTTNRRAPVWEKQSSTPLGAKVAGTCSLVLWFGIVIAGRWIAYL